MVWRGSAWLSPSSGSKGKSSLPLKPRFAHVARLELIVPSVNNAFVHGALEREEGRVHCALGPPKMRPSPPR
ncbi:hypothetical protein PC128_g1081 [Phytophthora cactorum]|nr:hypothetical protein PC128_g1081 [Phytophthora cactorum]